MLEIGIGHNWGVRPREEQPTYKQLTESAKSILDVSPAELARRRKEEALERLRPRAGKSADNKHSVKVFDHHKRYDATGKSRCLIGTADDFTTVADHDDLANHLYIADDPDFRQFGMEQQQGDEEPDDYEAEYDDTQEIAPGAVYSTASQLHQANLKRTD